MLEMIERYDILCPRVGLNTFYMLFRIIIQPVIRIERITFFK